FPFRRATARLRCPPRRHRRAGLIAGLAMIVDRARIVSGLQRQHPRFAGALTAEAALARMGDLARVAATWAIVAGSCEPAPPDPRAAFGTLAFVAAEGVWRRRRG